MPPSRRRRGQTRWPSWPRPMEAFDFFAMDNLEAIVDFGYTWTRDALASADLSWAPPAPTLPTGC